MINLIKNYNNRIWFKILTYVFFFIFFGIVMLIYQTVCEIGGSLFEPISLKTIVDDIIPFNIYIIYPYLLCIWYVLFAGIFFSFYKKISAIQIISFYTSAILMYLSCYLIYFIFPTTAKEVMITKFNPNILNLGMYKAVNSLYMASTPLGDFPSLHVAPMVFISIFLFKYWKVFFWILLPFAFLGAIGTVLLKFHVFVGFIGGAVMGMFGYYVIYEKFVFKKINNLIK